MQLEYFIKGESNKETILFVHGAGANASQFEKQLEFFSEVIKWYHFRSGGMAVQPCPHPMLHRFIRWTTCQ
jgi:predicted esterase